MSPTYLENLTSFLSFLTAYTHTLLSLRALYPPTSFVTSRFHNTAVQQSRHPLVCDWIRDAIAAVREDLLLGTVARIGVVVFSYGGEGAKTGSASIMERYMFDVSAFPVVGREERNMEIGWESGEGDGGGEDGEEDEERKGRYKEKELDKDVDVDLSEQYRAALIVLTSRTAKLAPLPPNCSFNICMELKDDPDVDPPIRHPQPWIPVQSSLQKRRRRATVRDEEDEENVEEGRSNNEGEDLGGEKVTPIRGVEAGVFRFDMWIEESKAKLAGIDSTKTSFASSR